MDIAVHVQLLGKLDFQGISVIANIEENQQVISWKIVKAVLQEMAMDLQDAYLPVQSKTQFLSIYEYLNYVLIQPQLWYFCNSTMLL